MIAELRDPRGPCDGLLRWMVRPAGREIANADCNASLAGHPIDDDWATRLPQCASSKYGHKLPHERMSGEGIRLDAKDGRIRGPIDLW